MTLVLVSVLQAPCKFDNELVLRQLRYTGMMETIKIRKAGYSVRMDFEVPDTYSADIGSGGFRLCESEYSIMDTMQWNLDSPYSVLRTPFLISNSTLLYKFTSIVRKPLYSWHFI